MTEFQEKAHHILNRLTNIGNQQLVKNNNTLASLSKFKQQTKQNQQENRLKLKKLHDHMRILHQQIKEDTQYRQNKSVLFLQAIAKVQKSFKNNSAYIKKQFTQQQHSIKIKVDKLLQQQATKLSEKIQDIEKLNAELMFIDSKISVLQDQFQTLRKTRYELEQRVYRQFIGQTRELKAIFERDIKQRQQKEHKLLQILKKVYKNTAQSLKQQENDRQANEKMFLAVLQKVVHRISAL